MKIDSIRIVLFLIAILLVVVILFLPISPIPILDSGSSEIDRLKSHVSALEQRIGVFEANVTEISQVYDECQDELAKCAPSGCTGKDLNYNKICKDLGLGSMLRVNADRKDDIIFQCITETQTTYLFYSRTVNSTIKILNAAYKEVLNVTGCEI